VVHADVEVHAAAVPRPQPRAGEAALAGHHLAGVPPRHRVQVTDRAAVEQCAGVAQAVAVEEVLAHREGAVPVPGRQRE
jgi:hypothetical protein